MDFNQRGAHQNQTINNSNPNSDRPVSSGSKKRRLGGGKFMRYITGGLLLAVTGLIIAVIFAFATSSPKQESKYVDDDLFQAVFLNNGQVYFGKITTLNNKYLELQNIYYLRVNQAVQPKSNSAAASNDVSLVKLGCELHGPSDQMIINSDQITFWENLKSDGQVAKAVASYVKANPNGQKCTTASDSSTSTNTTNKQQ